MALHIRPTAVDVRGFGFEFISWKSIFWGMEECLNDSVQVLLAISVNIRVLENKKQSLREFSKNCRSKKSFKPCKNFGTFRFVWP